MSTRIATAFVPVRFSMLLRGHGADDAGRTLVDRLRLPDRPAVYPPELLVLDPEGDLLARIEYGTPAPRFLAALEAVLRDHPHLALHAPPVTPPTDDAAVQARALAEAASTAPPAQVLPKLSVWRATWPDTHPEAARVRLAEGVAHARAGDHGEAARAWTELCARFPTHPLRHQADYLLKDPDAWPTRPHPAVASAAPAPLADRPVLQPYPEVRARNLAATREDDRYQTIFDDLPLVWVPPGTFDMGSTDPHLDREHPVRRVTLRQGFWMAAWPLTRGQVARLGHPVPPGPPEADVLPATGLSFHVARDLCATLSARLGVGVRLPTEAEWERAARGGLSGAEYPHGHTLTPADCNYGLPRAVPVASYPPNGFGLFDMVGNTQEWTADPFRDDAYQRTAAAVVDPMPPLLPPDAMPLRAVRGGLCGSEMCAVMCRNAFRVGLHEGYRGGSIAVRVVLDTLP